MSIFLCVTAESILLTCPPLRQLPKDVFCLQIQRGVDCQEKRLLFIYILFFPSMDCSTQQHQPPSSDCEMNNQFG